MKENKRKKRKTTPKQNVVAFHLANGLSQNEAAQKANVSPRTIQNWRGQPAFQELVDRQSDELIQGLIKKVNETEGEVFDFFYSIMNDPSEKTLTRLRAASSLLYQGRHIVDRFDFEERLRTIEDQLGKDAQPLE